MDNKPNIKANLEEVRRAIKAGKKSFIIRPRIVHYKALMIELRDKHKATFQEIQFYLRRFHKAEYSWQHIQKVMNEWKEERRIAEMERTKGKRLL